MSFPESSSGSEKPPAQPSIVDQAIDEHLQGLYRHVSDQNMESAESAWQRVVNDMVEDDFRKNILPQRDAIWLGATTFLEEHPALSTNWGLFGSVNCGASWTRQEQRDGSLVEVTTSLAVKDFAHTPELLRALELSGYAGTTRLMLAGGKFLDRQRGINIPTVLGVEAMPQGFRKQKLVYPHEQIERAVGRTVVRQAHSLEAAVRVQAMGYDNVPETILWLEIDRHKAELEDEAVRKAKKELLTSQRDPDSSTEEEGSQDPQWLLGERYEKLHSVYNSILISDPVVPESK